MIAARVPPVSRVNAIINRTVGSHALRQQYVVTDNFREYNDIAAGGLLVLYWI